MRVQIVVNFEGTLAELFAALPKSIEVQNLRNCSRLIFDRGFGEVV